MIDTRYPEKMGTFFKYLNKSGETHAAFSALIT